MKQRFAASPANTRGSRRPEPRRQVEPVARKIAARVASASTPPAPIAVHADDVPGFLRPPRFLREVAFRVSRPGVATGVAWTELAATCCLSRPACCRAATTI